MSEIVVAPGGAIDVASLDETICLICLAGSGWLEEGRKRFEIRPGLMALRLPRWTGRVRSSSERMRLVCFAWPTGALRALGPLCDALRVPRTLYGRSSVELAWRAAGELRIRDKYTPIALQLHCDGVALGLARNALYAGRSREPTLALRARRLLDRDLRQPLDLSRLAREAGCTPAYLSRLYRRTYGVSPATYVVRKRMELARDLLARSGKPIEDVARELGFHDASHFARHFRKHMGLSPSEFRARQRETKRDVKNVPE